MDILDPKDKEIFMNLCTDFAFKWVFGSERHKNVIIRFLNILFKDEGLAVEDVVFPISVRCIPSSS
jgi:hypothetical protein